MSYVIEYDSVEGTYEVRKEHPLRFFLLLGGALCLFLLTAACFWPEGREKLISMAIPGEDAVTVAAFRNMTSDMRAGTRIWQAIEAFCREVVSFGYASG